jgi:hypothetical protein
VAGMLGKTTPLGAIAGALAGPSSGGATGVDCTAALAIARGGQPGAAASPASPPAQQQQKPPNAGALLKQLFR